MKALLVLANNLAFSALLLTAQAQTPAPATSHDNPTPATPTATAKKAIGMDSKTVGRKMVQKSKPSDGPVRASQLK
jgi:hypothetical protein